VAAAGVYLNKSSGKKSSAVLAGGGSSDGGAEGGALPPLDESSRKVVWDEPKPAPSAGEAGAQGTVAQAGDGAASGPPAPGSVSDSDSAASAATGGASSTSTQASKQETATDSLPADAVASPPAATPANAPESAPSPKAPEPTVGQPSSETLETDSVEADLTALRQFKARFNALQPRQHYVEVNGPLPSDRNNQKATNKRIEDENRQTLRSYLQIIWDLIERDLTWRERKKVSKDPNECCGGMLQLPEPTREDGNIKFLEAWQEVALAAKEWHLEFMPSDQDGFFLTTAYLSSVFSRASAWSTMGAG
jgi:hypothetical protein